MPEQLISTAMHHTTPQRHVRSEADIPVDSQIDNDACSSHAQLLNSLQRWPAEVRESRLSTEKKPKLDDPAKKLTDPLQAEAMRAAIAEKKLKLYYDDAAKKLRLFTSFNLADPLKMEAMRADIAEEKAKLYSDDPDKKLRLFTSFNLTDPLQVMRKESQINLTDLLQIVKNEDLQEIRLLGAGASGTVYHGKWRGTDVAIKRFRTVIFSELAQDFWREAEILSMLHHPNVVAFYGVVKDGPGGTLATLTEFMVNGSLRHVLKREGKFSDLRKRLLIAMDAAFGMEYLHSKNIVHFDLKCDNLLVNLRDHSRPICKVGDFGLSKIRSNTLVSGGVRGTLQWMAPELLNRSNVSEKVDVFSFGIVMWELLTGEVPYANMDYGAIIGGVVNNTLRPPVPDDCEPEWRRLMEQFWSPDPAQRPAFTEIAARLQSMAAAI